jgi:lipopolysaccharide export system protein LptA
MKNKIFIIFTSIALIFFSNFVVAENLSIQANNITIDKKEQKTIFRDNVIFKQRKIKRLRVITRNMIEKMEL